MSMLDSGMDMASMFSPLRQRLIQGPLPGQQPQFDVQNPAQRFRAAQELGMARRRGQAGSPPDGGQSGPLTDAVAKAKHLALSGLGDEAPDELKELANNAEVDYPSFERAVRGYMSGREFTGKHGDPKQHDFSGQAQAAPQPTIGGPTPEGIAPGSIEIKQGSGADGRAVMSQQGIAHMANRANQRMGAGESMQFNPASAGGPAGFQVSGIQAPQMQPQGAPADPIVAMVNAFKGHVSDEMLTAAQQAINAGIPPQQVFSHLSSLVSQQQHAQATSAHEKEVESRTSAREAKADQRTEFSENARRLDETRHRMDELLHSDVMLRGGVQAGRIDLAQQSPNYKEYATLQGTMQNLRSKVMSGGVQQPGSDPAQRADGKDQQAATITWQGRQFQVGQTIKGADGRAYKLTGKMHSDGSPEAALAE